LGIHLEIEKLCIEILSLAIESAFQVKILKKPALEKLRVKIGVLQNLIRTENELLIIDDKTYLRLSIQIVGISKETTNWINYFTQKGS
jgi:hypothetical protein